MNKKLLIGLIVVTLVLAAVVTGVLYGAFSNNSDVTTTTTTTARPSTTTTIPEIQLSESEIIEKLKCSVVKVICYDYDKKTELSQGSGFFIDNRGTFITNAHVVEDCYYIKISNYLGVTFDVDVMYIYNGTYSDYAICRASNCYSSKPVEFATSAKIGDIVYALGYPNDSYRMITTKGKITNTNASQGSKNFYLNTAVIDHGSSGGVLVDSKGRVLGITTGQFSNGDYAALKYQDFKYDAEITHIGLREPLDYFHTVNEVWLTSYNMDDYFDIIVDATATSDDHVTYWVTVQLKNKYKNAKIILDSINLSITLKLDTEYQYQEIMSYGGIFNRIQTDTNFIYYRFWDESDLITGDTQYASSSIFILYGTEYYGMNISYDVDFFGGNGTILIYD